MKKTFTFGYDEFKDRFNSFKGSVSDSMASHFHPDLIDHRVLIEMLGFKKIGIKSFTSFEIKEDFFNRLVEVDVEFNPNDLNINPSLIEFNNEGIRIKSWEHGDRRSRSDGGIKFNKHLLI